jgi:hypothetical protein
MELEVLRLLMKNRTRYYRRDIETVCINIKLTFKLGWIIDVISRQLKDIQNKKQANQKSRMLLSTALCGPQEGVGWLSGSMTTGLRSRCRAAVFRPRWMGIMRAEIRGSPVGDSVKGLWGEAERGLAGAYTIALNCLPDSAQDE